MEVWTRNKDGISEHFQVSVTTIGDWLRRGCPFVERGKPGTDWVFDIREVRQWREQDLIKQAMAGKQNTVKIDAVERKSLAEAELKEIELAEKQHRVADVDQVVQDMGRVFRNISTRLQAIPIKSAPLLAACRTEAQFQAVITKQIDEALHELSELPFLTDESIPTGGKAVGPTRTVDREPVGRHTPDVESGKQRRTRAVGYRKGRIPAGHS